MNIEEIEIGSKWEDNLGKATYSKKGNLMKERARRFVIITNKTSNSIEFIDEGRFSSWIAISDFFRVEEKNKKIRFSKVE